MFAALNGVFAALFQRITGVFVTLNRHVCRHFYGQIAGRNTGRKRVNCGQKVGKMRQKTGDLRCLCGAFAAQKRANFGRISTIKRVCFGSIFDVKRYERGTLQGLLKT